MTSERLRVPVQAASLPTDPYMTVSEITCWIAFGSLKAPWFSPDRIENSYRWGGSPEELRHLVEALEARAAPAPSYIVIPQVSEGATWGGKIYTCTVQSPEAPKELRRIRAVARKHFGRLVTWGELVVMVREEFEALSIQYEALGNAYDAMMNAVRAGTLPVWARQELSHGRDNPASVHENVPDHFFMKEEMVVTYWGTISNRPDKDGFLNYRGRSYRDVRIKTSDVLRVWPMVSDKLLSDTQAKPSKTSRPGRTPTYDWDEFWVEVAIWTESNGFDPKARPDLQKHMMDWFLQLSTDPDNPVHPKTVQKKLQLLYSRVEERNPDALLPLPRKR